VTTPAELAAVQGQAMDGEARRRLLASMLPGHGSQVPLPQPASGPGVGISDVPRLEVTGEGYEVTAPDAPQQHKAYGPDRPQYAHESVGGVGFQGGRSEPAIRVFIGSRNATHGPDSVVGMSPQTERRSLWRRLLGR
jgi:hypothetical protein